MLLKLTSLPRAAMAISLLFAGAKCASASISINSYCTSRIGSTCTITSGTRSASASFAQSGGNLVLTLSNTSSTKAVTGADVLTAVFFTIEDSNGVKARLSKVSAMVAQGSTVLNPPTPNGSSGNVGAEWAYRQGLNNAPGGGTYGISSASLGMFRAADRFDTSSNLQGLAGLGGIQYGIVGSAGVDTAKAPATMKGRNALVKNSVVFTLSGLSADKAYRISHISFQFSPSLDGTCLGCIRPNVPEPSQLLISLFCGIGLLAAVKARSRGADA